MIPKASARERLAANLAATEVTLAAEDIAAIDALDDPGGRLGPDPDLLQRPVPTGAQLRCIR